MEYEDYGRALPIRISSDSMLNLAGEEDVFERGARISGNHTAGLSKHATF